ncbi:MAG: CPBP family intramembrane metalloprotease [Akkermansiaceae bacterium]|nr:CPBP family intramembrane metalloprotease [Armatimonadota bacterium]
MYQTLLVVLALIAFLALHIVPFALDARNRREYGKPFLAPRWSVWHLLYAVEAILLLLIVMCTFYFIGLGIVAKPLGISFVKLTKAITENNFADPQALTLFFLPATVLQNIASFVVPAAIITGLYGTKLRDIGLPAIPQRRAVIAGLLLGVLFLLTAVGIGTGLEQLAKQFDHVPAVKAMLDYEQANPVAKMTGTLQSAGPAGLFWGLLAVGIAAPIGEEMLFRGFALNSLSRRFGGGWGIVLSALLFAAPHTYSPIGLSVIFLMGLSLGHVYRVSGSLWTVILIHAVNNSAQILFVYFAP